MTLILCLQSGTLLNPPEIALLGPQMGHEAQLEVGSSKLGAQPVNDGLSSWLTQLLNVLAIRTSQENQQHQGPVVVYQAVNKSY